MKKAGIFDDKIHEIRIDKAGIQIRHEPFDECVIIIHHPSKGQCGNWYFSGFGSYTKAESEELMETMKKEIERHIEGVQRIEIQPKYYSEMWSELKWQREAD